MEISEDAYDYANSFRELVRRSYKGKKAFDRWARLAYGDLVGEDAWGFLEDMTGSLSYKFSDAIGLEYEVAVKALQDYMNSPRKARSELVRLIEKAKKS